MINKNMIKTLFLITLLQFAFTDDVKECQDFTTNNISQVNDAWEIKNKLNVPQYYKINNNDFDDEVTKVPFYSQCSKEEIYVQSNNMNLDQEDFDENEWKTRDNYEYIFGLQQRFDTDTIIRRKITSSRNNLPSKCTVQFDLYLQGYRTNDVFYIYLDEDSGLQQINSFDCASYVSKNAVQKDPITGALVTPARKCYDSVYFRTLTAFKIFIKPFTYIPKKSTYYLQFQGKFKAKSLGDEAFWGIKNLDITCTYDQVPCLGGQTRQTDGSCACPNNTQWSSSKNQCDCLGSHTELNNDKSKCVCSSGWVPNPSLDNTFKLNCYPEKCPGNQIPDTVTASCICPGNTKLIDKTKCGCSKDLNLVLNNDQNSCVCSLTGEFILQKTNNILISCSQCPKNTASNDTQTKCIGCQNNLILINRKDCVCPSDMQYQSLTKKCLSCPSNLIASLSVADQCECPDGLIRNPKKQECICPQGDYAQNFDENGKLIQCSKCPENYIILPNDLRTCVGCNANSIWNTERNKCICPQGLSWLIGSNQCGCTGNNTIMQGKICVCQSGFVPVRKGDLTILNCRPIPKCNESCFSCVKDDDKCNKCKGNLEFDSEDDTICKCPSGLVLNEKGDNCNQCAEGQIVNPSNPKKCICPNDLVLDSNTGKCVCPNNTQLVNGICGCPGANTLLQNKVCVCKQQYVPVRKGATKTLVCRPIPKCNESCFSCVKDDDKCNKCKGNLEFDPEDDTICKCPSGLVLNENGDNCNQCAEGQIVNPSNPKQCICPNDLVLDSNTGKCVCPNNTQLVNGICGCPGANTLLQNKVCVCKQQYVPVRKGATKTLVCRPIPKCNESCFSCVKDDDKCNKCKGNLEFDPEDDTICKCPSGLVLNENGDNCNQCAEGQIVNPSNPKQCICSNDLVLDSNTGKCVCPNNTQLVNGICGCPGANTLLQNKVCVCKQQYAPVRKGATKTLVCRPIPKCNESCFSCVKDDDKCNKCKGNLEFDPEDDTICKCPSGLVLNENGDNCNQCAEGQIVNPSNPKQCICLGGQILNTLTGLCSCPNNTQLVNGRCNCPGANTQLLGRQCFCISDFVPVRKGVTSTLVCRPIPKCNESCLSCRDNDDFCVKCLNNLIPNPNDDTQCKCPEDSTLNKIEMKCYRNCTQRQMNDPTDSLKCICKYPFQINPGSTSCNCPPDQSLNSDGTGCETNIQDCASVGAVLGQDALGKSICICPQDTITKINEFTGLIESCDKSDVPTLCSKTCEKCLPNSNICVDCPPGNSLTDDRKSCQPSKCHPSCHCDKISKECASCAICTRCREPSMAVMIQQDYCACQTPQFVLKPDSSWQCKSVPQSVPIPVCDWQLFNQIVNMVVVSNCSLQKDEQNNTFVVDAIHYDFRRLSVELSADCQKELKTQVFIATDCLNYKPLDLKYLSIINSTQTKIKIPLIDLYDLNAEYKIDTRTIYQRLCFAIEFSNSNATIRQHKFEMRVFTNRDQVEVFHLDVSKQITEGCDKGQQCIIVADLDVKGSVCKDQSCVDFLPENIIPSYIVGDHMYVRIQFVDNTYKKFLTVVSVKFVDDRGIYNYEKNSQYWTIRQQPGSVDVNILLFQPQINARVEVQLKISLNPDSRLRGLVESTNTELITSMFRTQVLQSKNTVSAQSDNEKSSFGFNLIFTVLGLLVCLLI
ncbi:hypothetical protein IMG5_185060 [Ichthyophthirius multifiliis]|uniref:EGF-like domain-containing protein n=1 Tax=Ichthyophthirius multifiliis TaxID=5932 RepID=G0R3F3_ICHMU|nr:hypothetical protein IMG5_185060 [Ichthyophthirius multifiliis]EGR28004.1 hypothetical protein IMG5_185060 [Ichthyophthirius multifiliis]|eukprot:XP_004027349.1 hypothetical protein IMG5_185060 [Ichthyophthirius multifiliis]